MFNLPQLIEVTLQLVDSTLCMLDNFSSVLFSADFSQNQLSKKSFRNSTRVSNSLEPDPARQVVGPDLFLNCLQRLSADNTSKQRVKVGMVFEKVNWV